MSNIAFVIWMVLSPVAYNVCDYLEHQINGKKYDNGTELIHSIVCVAAYVAIGVLLFEG